MKRLKSMRHSLKYRLAAFVILALGLSVALCFVASKTLLDDYFVYSERRNISKLYKEINDTLNESGQIDSLYLESLSGQKNVKIMIVEKKDDGFGNNSIEMVYSSAGKGGYMYRAMYELLQNLNSSALLQSEMNEIYTEIREKGYVVLDHKNDRLDLTSIDLLGSLGDNYLIILDSSMESLETAANIAVHFLAIASVIVSLLASVFVYFYSKRMTRPIEEMSEIAGRMANLDFEAKVTNLPEDEIGHLGQSMNQLSSQLESTITELKNANVSLMRDNEEKTQIDEMRKEFLAHVSHELKTPIALISGYAEGLADGVNDDEESRNFYCEVIMDEAKKMNQMVANLMSLNELEFGQNQLEVERFDISEMIFGMVEVNKKRFAEKQAELNVRYAGNGSPGSDQVGLADSKSPVFVWADQLKIEDVLNNYLSNAFHFVAEGGKVEVKVEEVAEKIRISVYNDGPGIPQDDLEKIWIKFYKVDKARTREYGGSGVGLSIVAAIMNAHHMKYGVENQGKGVEFWFELEKA